MENTSNTSFLRQTYADEEQIDKLIASPAPAKAVTQARKTTRRRAAVNAGEPFQNEPLLDFSREENRSRFAGFLKEVRKKFARSHPLWIGGDELETKSWLNSVNPAAPEEIVGRVPVAAREEAERAVVNALGFFPEWRRTPASERATVMFRAADIIPRKGVELAAGEVVEGDQNLREA